MSEIKVYATTTLSVALCLLALGVRCQTSSERRLVITPPGPLVVEPGMTVSFTCSISLTPPLTSDLKWHYGDILESHDRHRFQEEWIEGHKLRLTISQVQPRDAGPYTCSTGNTGYSSRVIRVLVRNSGGSKYPSSCLETQFRCGDGLCIFDRYRCDHVSDCLDSSDEAACSYKPCVREHEFECDNGQCIPRDYVCDKYMAHDCRDHSDERDCPDRFVLNADGVTQETWTVEATPHHHHGFHFNAIYSAVATVLGVALVASVLVITLRRVNTLRESSQQRTSNSLVTATRPAHSDVQIFRFYGILDRLGENERPDTPPWQFRSRVVTARRDNGLYSGDNGDVGELLLPSRIEGASSISGHITVNMNTNGKPEFILAKPPSYEEILPRADSPPPPYATLERPESATDACTARSKNTSVSNVNATEQSVAGAITDPSCDDACQGASSIAGAVTTASTSNTRNTHDSTTEDFGEGLNGLPLSSSHHVPLAATSQTNGLTTILEESTL